MKWNELVEFVVRTAFKAKKSASLAIATTASECCELWYCVRDHSVYLGNDHLQDVHQDRATRHTARTNQKIQDAERLCNDQPFASVRSRSLEASSGKPRNQSPNSRADPDPQAATGNDELEIIADTEDTLAATPKLKQCQPEDNFFCTPIHRACNVNEDSVSFKTATCVEGIAGCLGPMQRVIGFDEELFTKKNCALVILAALCNQSESPADDPGQFAKEHVKEYISSAGHTQIGAHDGAQFNLIY
ncbi:hypothetical protein OBBRIDRAFT_804432 [Obba rivulosa]|uniref:Uncharacterized protein n=1 Tax=Obba rivulosa TaxID=1052685 RepID=A0A8E2AV93_9APHY|nr:hypothetical protein OBBRIDRAFT_804432 [Obba rivulosa]